MGKDDTPRPGFTYWVSFREQGVYRNPELNINGRRETKRGYLTELLNYYAEDFLRTAVWGSRPFLLYLSYKAVHAPFDPPRWYEGLYAGERVICSPGCDDRLQGKPALTRNVPGTTPPRRGQGPSDDDIRNQLTLLASVDEGVGQIVETLADAGVLDRTVIIFTSDNGYFYREHGLGDKRWAYEESIRIPLLVRYPPLARSGTRIDELVLNVDLAPTLLELGGVAVPPDVHGQSFLPLLKGETEGWRDAFVTEYFEEIPFPRIPTWEAIRTERWKYIRYPSLGNGFDELYDLQTDPFELQNQVNSSDLSDIRDMLQRELERLLTFPRPLPEGQLSGSDRYHE
jgi:N-acetylglucosamine-6-sulfatase